MSGLTDALANLDAPPHLKAGWRVTVTADSAELETDQTEQHLTAADDWDGVLRHFGLNPSEFTIVDDTVRMSSWQQSKALEDGSRDLVTLYSYRARFRRVTDRLPDADLDAVIDRVRKWRPIRKTPGSGVGQPATFYQGWADWQTAKSAGGGVAMTTQRVLDMYDQTLRRVKELRRVGRNITAGSFWNMGDPIEGCDGHYESQLFTVELTQRQQLNLVLDLWLTGMRTFAPLFDDLEFGSVLCNHGEWTRRGSRPVTSDSDNVGGYLADTLRTVLTDRPGFDHVRFSVPHDEMTMLSVLSGVPVAFAHGHKTPGTAKELEWMRGQSIRLLRDHGKEPRLWMTAHRHHLDIKDFGPWWRIQHPTLDGGSKWFEDVSGMWSTPGTFTCLVGEHEQAGGPLDSGGTGFSDPFVILP